MIKISDELKIQIPIEADGSSTARAKFQNSINDMVGKMNTSNIPKIQLTVSKINGSKAIAKFKKEIQDAIGGVEGNRTVGSSKNNYWDGVFKQSVKDLTAKNVDLNPLNNYYKELEKQGLADVAVQAKKNIELTKQQTQADKKRTDQLQKLIENIKFANSPEANTKHNAIENSFDKLGANDNAIDAYKKLQELKSFTIASIAEMHSKYGTTDSQSLAEKLVDSKDIKDLTDFNGVLTQYKTSLEQIDKLSKIDSPTFVKDVRNATNDKNLEEFILTLTRFEKINDKFKSNSGLASQFESIKSAAAGFKATGNFSDVDVKNLRAQFSKLNIEMTNLGLNGQSAFGKLRAQMEKLGVYLSASAVLMGAVRQIKQMTQNVIELDNALNSLQMVTGYSNLQMEDLLKTYQGLASELSTTTSEVLEGSEVWLRQGRSIAETNELIRTSTVFSKVAMIDAATASDLLTSSINGYGVAAKDAMSIVDALAAVDMAAATSSEEMSVAMQKTAASAKLAGVPMNELIAYIATISETSRASAEIVGTAMKSILSRITQVKAGKLVDEDGEDISNVSKVLAQYGVAVQNTNGTLRDANVIISELSNTWGKLTNAEQQEVAGAVAGLKQKEQFTILMENWSRVTKLATVATNSNGYALEKFNVYQESTAAKMSELQNQFQILSTSLLDSGLIKGTIDTGTGLLGALTWIIENLGTIPTLATVAAGSISALSNKGRLGQVFVSQNRKYALLWLIGDDERVYNKNGVINKSHIATSLKWCA